MALVIIKNKAHLEETMHRVVLMTVSADVLAHCAGTNVWHIFARPCGRFSKITKLFNDNLSAGILYCLVKKSFVMVST